MKFLPSIFAPLVVGAGIARAALYTTQPIGSTVYQAGQPSTVSWIDNGTSPSLAELQPMKLELFGSGDSLLSTLATGVDPKSLSYDVTISPSIGSGSDYYLRFVCDNPPVMFYTSKFTITNMTGGPSTSGSNTISGPPTAQRVTPAAPIASTSYKVYPLVTLITPTQASIPTITTPTQARSTEGSPTRSVPAGTSQIGRGGAQSQTNGAGGRVDMEKIKFRLVFILWPALMGITMAM